MKRIVFIIFSSVLFLFSASCQNSAGNGSEKKVEEATQYVVLSQKEFKERLAKGDDYLLIDVRTPEEFESGHIEGAVNIDFLNASLFDEEAAKLRTDETLMIYCRSGNRSRKAAGKLQAMGFKKIYDLDGGYNDWTE